MVSGAGRVLGLWRQRGRGESPSLTWPHPASKQGAGDQHAARRRCNITFYSRCHGAASSSMLQIATRFFFMFKTGCVPYSISWLYIQLSRRWPRPTCPPSTCRLWTERSPLLETKRRKRRRRNSRVLQIQVGQRHPLHQWLLISHVGMFTRRCLPVIILFLLTDLSEASKPLRDRSAAADSLAGSADVSGADKKEAKETEDGKGEWQTEMPEMRRTVWSEKKCKAHISAVRAPARLYAWVCACMQQQAECGKPGESSIGRLLMSFNEVTLNWKLAEELTFQQDWILAEDTAQQRKKRTCEELRHFLKQKKVLFFVQADSTHFQKKNKKKKVLLGKF